MKDLVIDTSIARSAGETDHPTSTNCRQWLDEILNLKCVMVFNAELFAEWGKHESGYARRWRLSMIAKKRMRTIRDSENIALREAIDGHAPSDNARQEMLHDVHLLELALKADNIISSLNDRDRDRFKAICKHVSEIRQVLWVNPDKVEENCLDWLKNGAPVDDHRKLGNRPLTDD